jgi:autotransporter-associated beta strand protein
VSGGGGLTKARANRLSLEAANTYAGDTRVSVGAVRVAGAGTLGAGGTAAQTLISTGAYVLLDGPITTDDLFVLAGAGDGNGALQARGGSSKLNWGVLMLDDSTVGVLNAADTLTIDGEVAGSFRFTKAGPGTLVLNNADNDFGGPHRRRDHRRRHRPD